jgi:hypothetical protein
MLDAGHGQRVYREVSGNPAGTRLAGIRCVLIHGRSDQMLTALNRFAR